MPSDTPPEVDVCVVGYGPVGATLACLLADAGLSVLVLERDAEVYRLPRAVHFDDEVMRVFQTLGLAHCLVYRAADSIINIIADEVHQPEGSHSETRSFHYLIDSFYIS